MDPGPATKRPGRPTKHDWSDKKDVCYKLYVDDELSVREVIDYFVNTFGISKDELPSARDFSRQFTRWGFPDRQLKLSDEDEEKLVQRIKQLWETNYMQKQMLEILTEEGWSIDEFKLARIRRKHGILLRLAAGYNDENMGPGTGKKRKTTSEDQGFSMQHASADENAAVLMQESSEPSLNRTETVTPSILPPDVAAKRTQRMIEIQTYSDSQLQAKKRRRRIRGLAHLPPDEPGMPPRYKSETSLDECKAYLSLSNELYKEVRNNFESICIEMGIIKKRLCEPGAWRAAKDRLIRESTHLSAILNPVHGDLEQRDNALEVVCADVTKRMRTQQKQIFIKDANNILGLNPEQSKSLRRQFYEILKQDHFQSMLLCGKAHWEELRQQWLNASELAQQLNADAETNEDKKRSIDVLLRDAMKRHNEDNVSRIPHMVQPINTSYGPGPGPARRGKKGGHQISSSASKSDHITAQSISNSDSNHSHIDIDPALLASLATGQIDASVAQEIRPATSTHLDSPIVSTPRQSIAAYFRLSSTSQLDVQHPKIWLATLTDFTLSEVHKAATSKAAKTHIVNIFGILKGIDGQESHFQIDSDDELEAYFAAVQEDSKRKISFLTQLESF